MAFISQFASNEDVANYEFEYADHTADVKIIVTGDSLGSCFQGASKAVFSMMLEKETNSTDESIVELQIQSESLEALLYDFIDRLLTEFYTSELIPLEYNELVIETSKGSFNLRSKSRCCQYDPEHHGHIDEIKAMTYNQMEIAKDRKQLRFVVDV